MRRTFFRIAWVTAAVLAPVLLIGWTATRLTRAVSPAAPEQVPTTRAKKGKVVITVTANGELQGGKSEMLVAPMTGGSEMAITSLREPGEMVRKGDIVVQFDTTEQTFKLQEAEGDLAEAEQKVIQAEAENLAKEEEARYALSQAKANVKLAELETRRNPLLAAIVARENTLALQAANDALAQLQEDLAQRKETSRASIAIQEAARHKATVQAETARRNIEAMTLRANSDGYVSVQQNTNGNFMYWGMQLPTLQVGDSVRAGMAVAQIPDLENWEVVARIGELDRGHLSPGQAVDVRVMALGGKPFSGKVKNLGGTTGPPWDRHFDCRISLEDPGPELRPGMSTKAIITTGVIPNGTWVPSQALFDRDGHSFVYIQTPSGFMPRDVKLLRRSESQAVIEGLGEGQIVAMAAPGEQRGGGKGRAGAMDALAP